MNKIKSTFQLNRIKRYYVDHKLYLLVSLILAIASLLFGIIININGTVVINPTTMSFMDIFVHNIVYGGAIILSGFLTLGIGASILTFINFYSLGKIIITVCNSYGSQPILSGILPHAIIELSALIMCCTLGFETLRIAKNIKNNASGKVVKSIFIGDNVLQIIIVTLLFAIAALIESTISFV